MKIVVFLFLIRAMVGKCMCLASEEVETGAFMVVCREIRVHISRIILECANIGMVLK